MMASCGDGYEPSSTLTASHAHGPACSNAEDIGIVQRVERPSDMSQEFLSLAAVDNVSLNAESFFCPTGFKYDPQVLFCTQNDKALGPFPKKMIDRCIEDSGGSACSNNVWNKEYAFSLRGKQQCPVGTTARPSGFCSDGKDVYGPFGKLEVAACQKAKGGDACIGQRWSESFAESLKVPRSERQPLQGLKIAIDSGHGGSPEGWEPGAVSPFYSSVTDYQLNIRTTSEVKEYLEAKGAKVTLFQYPNAYQGPDLEGRGSRSKGNDLFVSVHFNRFNSIVQGSEVFTHVNIGSPSDAKLAYAIQDRLVAKVCQTLIGFWTNNPSHSLKVFEKQLTWF